MPPTHPSLRGSALLVVIHFTLRLLPLCGRGPFQTRFTIAVWLLCCIGEDGDRERGFWGEEGEGMFSGACSETFVLSSIHPNPHPSTRFCLQTFSTHPFCLDVDKPTVHTQNTHYNTNCMATVRWRGIMHLPCMDEPMPGQ